MKPIQVNLGHGKVVINTYTDETGHGVVLRAAKQPHAVGTKTITGMEDHPDGQHEPTENEMYIHIDTIEGGLVLLEQLVKCLTELLGWKSVLEAEQEE